MIGLDAGNLGAVNAAMDRALMGHGYAKSAIDIACWDALGRTVGLPVCDLLGGRARGSFPLYLAVPLGSAEEMTDYVEARRGEGIHRFQLKIGADPYEDAARTRRCVEATGPEDIVVADANGGWRLQDAVVAARALEALERVFFEQPCPTIEECLIVRQRTTLPMVLDECIRDVHSLLRAYEAGALEAFNLKISQGRRFDAGQADARPRRRARPAGDDRGHLGRRPRRPPPSSHLAASTPPETLFTVSFMNDWTNEHVAGHEPRSAGGFGSAPDAPGPRRRRRRGCSANRSSRQRVRARAGRVKTPPVTSATRPSREDTALTQDPRGARGGERNARRARLHTRRRVRRGLCERGSRGDRP